MPRLLRTQTYPDTRDIKEPTTKTWAEAIVRLLDDIVGKVAAIPFNRSEKLSVADTGDADMTITLTHHLSRVAEGIIVTRIDKAGIIYVDSDDYADWTDNQIKFKCSVTNASVNFFLF